MDGAAEQEEEEVRPKRGKSIRLPEDTDLEAQRYHSPTLPSVLPHHHYFVLRTTV